MSEPRADALVMFGLTGDLGDKKLLPALLELARAGELDMPVIGVGRSDHSDDELRRMLAEATATDRDDDDDGAGAGIDLSYISGSADDDATYDALVERLNGASCPVIYAALPPALFGDVAEAIAQSALPNTTRLVLEKPFGEDAASAQQLYDTIDAAIGADCLFLVDHFLAKAEVEALPVIMAGNPIINGAIGSGMVSSIDIEMLETDGLEGRGSFYESVGAIDDVVQNHMVQMLAAAVMHAPEDDTDGAYLRARAAALRSIETVRADDVVLGQFDGYRDLDDVAADSTTETFVDASTFVHDQRWGRVPIRLRTGKQMATESTAITIRWNNAAVGDAAGGDGGWDGAAPNSIRYQVKPDPHIEISISTLDPLHHAATPLALSAELPDSHGPLDEYARMLLDAIVGRRRHFAQIDDVVESWRIVAEMRNAGPPRPYRPGSLGPD